VTTLALIPARGGSKGIPGKNIVDLYGKPLIAWTIQAALAAECIDRVVVSTDAPDIAQVARDHGAEVPFTRPAELSGDEASSLAVALHALRHYETELGVEVDTLVLLQPTSPFRGGSDIDLALARMRETGAPSVISVVAARHHPTLLHVMDHAGRLVRCDPGQNSETRRQKFSRVFAPNGAIYGVRAAILHAGGSWYGEGVLGYEMAEKASLDIDEPWDLQLARLVAPLMLGAAGG
jgi:CMP-N,N'-diacetyllegionaminic acid synthase